MTTVFVGLVFSRQVAQPLLVTLCCLKEDTVVLLIAMVVGRKLCLAILDQDSTSCYAEIYKNLMVLASIDYFQAENTVFPFIL